MPSALWERQTLFTELVGRLIARIYASGYKATLGDALAHDGHRDGSCHYVRLAIDVNLFKDGEYLMSSGAHLPFGEFWEGLHPLARWGGRFGDGNHYSVEWEGRK